MVRCCGPAEYQRLVERGKKDIAYATPLAGDAIRQVCSGRCVGTKLNVRDVGSRHAQRTQGITVERLDQFDAAEGEWGEALVEKRNAGPTETAAAKIDIAAWLRLLARKKGRIAQALANGEATGEVARMFGLSAGPISQLRRKLQETWAEFQGKAAA